MLHLIGNPITCTKRVLITLYELKLKLDTDFTITQLNVMAGEQKQPAHLAKHPFGVVPVLEDGDFTVFETRAICRYLATKYRGQGTQNLIPDPMDIKGMAIFEQWASVELTCFDTFTNVIVTQKLFNKVRGIEPIPAVVESAKKGLSEKLDVYEGILAKQKYMGGDEFSLIDIFYMPWTNRLFEAGEGAMIESRPHLKAWWQEVTARDSWKDDVDPDNSKMWAGMVKSLGY
ncbi:Glutathione S-transferase [Hyphodiscus hymeniophilus]|uniref:glutathione transferase n=1 Tax=Hyphodiscus hymeniophilus TaxID=353542 RepID=A0A9P6VJL9_9HELO|nr:Glutathione S-transferase [Hyphodiscus hymeniophilus]